MTQHSINGATSAVAGPEKGRREKISVDGLELEVLRGGSGPNLLVLHDYEYLNEWQPFEEALAQSYTVLVPSHPGFGHSARPALFDSIDDYAYLYLDMLKQLRPGPTIVMGLGLGGWIAAEVAVRSTQDIAGLVLVDSFGIKVGDRETRDIADTFIVGAQKFVEMTWHDPARGTQEMKVAGLTQLDEPTLTELLTNRQTTAIIGWKPFLHTPKLRSRLHRIEAPTLVLWGQSDGVVSTDYGRAFAGAIPNARFETIANAGHYPYLEQPRAFADAVRSFLQTAVSAESAQPGA